MKSFTLLFLYTLISVTIISAQAGFNSVTNLSPLSIVSSTGENPQSKVWTYAGQHWAVLTNSADGTSIYRLDGTTWTNVLILASGTTSKVDVKVVGNLAHIFFWKGVSSYLFSVEYDPATNKYKKWALRNIKSDVSLETGVKSATIDIDATGRMWLASDGTSTVNVRWSDAPYSTWSGPITIATGTTKTDLCAVVVLPSVNKIGVFWSNKNTKRFGFKTHSDGTDPALWSEDEAPGAATALNIGLGLADNQFNIKATQSGTLYSTVKTNYSTAGYPQIALLIRRPDGTWESPYPVTFNEGTFPIVILNESVNRLKVIYSLSSGTVSYKESPISAINFSLPFTLLNGLYNYATSTKATYNPEVVILASNSTTAVGVLGIENNSLPDQTPPTVESINRQAPTTDPTNATSVTFRLTFSEAVSGVDTADFTLTGSTVNGTISSVTPINGNAYDVTVTSVSGSGTLGLNLNSSGTGIIDIAGNAITGGFTVGQTYTINQGIPTLTSVAIASNNGIPTLAKPGDLVSLSFTASEPINPPVVSIATNAVTTTAGSGNSFTATYIMTASDASGVIPFSIAFSNTAGTSGTQATATTNGSSVNFDKTQPTITSINRQSPVTDPTNAASVTFRVTFSEAVSEVDITDFNVVTGGTASGVVSSATPISSDVYDLIITSVSGNGTLRLDLNSTGTGITDAAGNAITGDFTGGETYTIQQGIPTLTSVSIASGNSAPSLAKPGDMISLTFTSSEPINPPLVSIATHTVSATNGSGNNYVASYTMTVSDASGNIPFSIDFSSTTGVAGIQVTATTNSSSVSFDKTLPTVVSIDRQSPAIDPTNATSVTYRLTFSEAVNGVDISDFELTTSGTATGVLSSVTHTSSSVYDLTVSFITGNGMLRPDLKSTGTDITDAAGNGITGGFTGGQAYTIQQVIPTLTSVSIASNNSVLSLAKPGDVVSLSFAASEPINSPAVTIAAKTATVTATGGNSYSAVYTMLGTDAPGAVPFTIDFTSVPGSPGAQVISTTNGTSVTFDNTAPSVVSINRQSPLTDTTSITSVTFRTIFDEKVTDLDPADFIITIISGTVNATLAANSVTAVGTAGTTYDVTVSSISGNGILRLDLQSTGTGITDAAGNAIGGGFTGGQTYTISQPPQPGFTSVIPLTPVSLENPTKDKPQAKVWNYANQWWCALSVATGETKIFRLDGVSWTETLTLTTVSSKPDCWVSGDLVHLLLFKGATNNSLLYSVKYDVASNTYKLWSTRPTAVKIKFPAGSETVTIVVDGNGRMWAASDGTSEIKVWWSDAPYSIWSAPITIATGVKDDDICSLTAMPALGKIGIFWSNQTTKKFGFKTHTNGTDPAVWSSDEVPGLSAALDNIGAGMADDHMNLKVASDGTVYCAAKTSYEKPGYPKLILLVRRPSGAWDNPYTVTMYPDGTQATLLLNEAKGKLTVVYTTVENGGDIKYSESAINNIAFGPSMTLISSPGVLYNYATSTHENYTSEIVILATNMSSSPIQAVGLLVSDDQLNTATTTSLAKTIVIQPSQENTKTILSAYPNPMSASATLRFTLEHSSFYNLSLYDTKGIKLKIVKSGWSEAGAMNTALLDGALLPAGLYLGRLQTDKTDKVIKIIVKK